MRPFPNLNISAYVLPQLNHTSSNSGSRLWLPPPVIVATISPSLWSPKPLALSPPHQPRPQTAPRSLTPLFLNAVAQRTWEATITLVVVPPSTVPLSPPHTIPAKHYHSSFSNGDEGWNVGREIWFWIWVAFLWCEDDKVSSFYFWVFCSKNLPETLMYIGGESLDLDPRCFFMKWRL